MVRTVLGDIAGDVLGHTQCHEHLFIEKGPSFGCNPALCMEDEDRTVDELREYVRAGGRSVVDAQPPFCGRMAEKLVAASMRANVHIIAVTGVHKRQFYPENAPVLTMTREALADFFVSELREGMISEKGERFSACAGIVKIAFENDGSLDDRLTDAAIDAALETGAPLMVHTEKNCGVLSLINRAVGRGVSAERVIICHLDRTSREMDVHRAALETGACLNYDSIHRYKYLSDEEELDTICKMLEFGYEKQLLLSLDTTNRRLKSYGGETGLDYILTDFLPMLRLRGVSEEQLHMMSTENPAAALAFR